MDAAGIWHGEYRYEHEDDGCPVAFTMHLAQDASGHVSGTVTEGPGGMPEEGRIVGTARSGRLQFLKLMPVAHVGGPDGTRELSAYLAEAGHEMENSIEHPQILYQGRLAEDGRTVAGTWRLEPYRVPLKGGQTFKLYGGRGVWSATRAGS